MNLLIGITVFAAGSVFGTLLNAAVAWFNANVVFEQPEDTKMSFGTFLQRAGADIEKVLEVATGAAKVAEPVVDILFPAFAALYNGAVNEASTVLAAGSSAAAQGGSATVQLENVAAAVAPSLIAYAQQQGLPAPTAAHITAFTQAILASLQVLVDVETGAAPTVTVSTTSAPSTAAPASSTAAPVVAVAPVAAAAAVAQTGPGLSATVPA